MLLSSESFVELVLKNESQSKSITTFNNFFKTASTNPYLNIEDLDDMKIVNPKGFIQEFIINSKHFNLNNQEDVGEFLIHTLDIIHEEIKRPIECSSEKIGYFKEYSYIVPCFYSYFKTVILCVNCSKISEKYEIVSQLLVEISRDNITLAEALSNIFKKELLEDYKCDKCDKINTSFKKIYPIIFSKNLIIVIMRFGNSRKKKIIIPSDNLDILGYNYNLKSSIFHYGLMEYGHYISVNKRNNRWFYCNDTIVKEVNKINLSNSYLLLFERSITIPEVTTISSLSDKSHSSSDSSSRES